VSEPKKRRAAAKGRSRLGAALKKLCGCGLRSLKFQEAEEASFREAMRRDLVIALSIAGVCGLIIGGLSLNTFFREELPRVDKPMSWSTSDPRTVMFLIQFLHMSMFLFAAVAGFASLCCPCLRRIDFEWVAISISVFTIIQIFHLSPPAISRAYGLKMEDVLVGPFDLKVGEFYGLLVIAVIVSGACQVLPLRTHRGWLVPFVGVVAYPLKVAIHGSYAPNHTVSSWTLLWSLCVISHAGARRSEALRRTKWRAAREALERESVARGMQAISWVSCDVVPHLGEDLCVVNESPQLDAFFGQAMLGRSLADFMAEGERESFAAAARKAAETGELQSTPSTLELPFASLSVQFVVVHVEGLRTQFVVGISQIEHRPKVNTEVVAAEPGTAAPEDAELAAPSIAPSAAATEKIFNDIERLCIRRGGEVAEPLGNALKSVVRVGIQEHWFLSKEDLEIVSPPLFLGKGGFGAVVWGRLRGTPVAIKLPRVDGGKDHVRLVLSFCNEIRLFRRVRHANIVAFHGATVDTESGDVAMVFDVVEGMDMAKYVGQVHSGGFPQQRKDVLLGKALLDVACALRYLHMMDPAIVHGDLKSSNILVSLQADSIPKASLLDFGLSRLLAGNVRPLGGTAEWMAPEVHERSGPPSASSDVYSFGLLAHFTTTGVHPHTSVDPGDIFGRFERLRWPEGSPFREECQRLTKDCMLLRPSARPGIVDIHTALLDWLLELDDAVLTFGNWVLCQYATAWDWDDGLRAVHDASKIELPPGMGQPKISVTTKASKNESSSMQLSPPTDDHRLHL